MSLVASSTFPAVIVLRAGAAGELSLDGPGARCAGPVDQAAV